MNCDRVVFARDVAESLRGQPIVSISQRNSGYQTLPEELLDSGLNLKKLDLSGNSIYKLMNRSLRGQPRLERLALADNLLGDSLNPIFSSNEFHGMKQLRILDLSRNNLRSIEEGIFKGCENLERLYLDGNQLTMVPTISLKGPKFIRVLSLSGNNIGALRFRSAIDLSIFLFSYLLFRRFSFLSRIASARCFRDDRRIVAATRLERQRTVSRGRRRSFRPRTVTIFQRVPQSSETLQQRRFQGYGYYIYTYVSLNSRDFRIATIVELPLTVC